MTNGKKNPSIGDGSGMCVATKLATPYIGRRRPAPKITAKSGIICIYNDKIGFYSFSIATSEQPALGP